MASTSSSSLPSLSSKGKKDVSIDDPLLAGLKRIPISSSSTSTSTATLPAAPSHNRSILGNTKTPSRPLTQRTKTQDLSSSSSSIISTPYPTRSRPTTTNNNVIPPESQEPKHTHRSKSKSPRPRPRPRPRPSSSSKDKNVPLFSNTFPPLSPSTARIDSFDPIPRFKIHEVIESATALPSSSSSNNNISKRRQSLNRIVNWLNSGIVDPTLIFRSIVTGSDTSLSSCLFNIRVLSLVHCLCLEGEPFILSRCLFAYNKISSINSTSTSTNRPPPVLRIIFDILRILHPKQQPEDILSYDEIIFNLRICSNYRNGSGNESGKGKDGILNIVYLYALLLGRKFIFHNRFNDIEFNYSLDRLYRTLSIENHYDIPINNIYTRINDNDERQKLIISIPAFIDIVLITMISCATYQAIDNLKEQEIDPEIKTIILADAVNSIALASYLEMKTVTPEHSDNQYDLSTERSFLRRIVRNMFDHGRGPNAGTAKVQGQNVMKRIFRKFVDDNVLQWLLSADDKSGRPVRPDSLHREEIVCHFTSFQALHNAMSPRFPDD